MNREVDRLLASRPPTDEAVRRGGGAQEARGRQAVPPPRVDDARASVRARRHAADRAALLRRLQLFADGDFGRLGRHVEDEHAARRAREHPAVAREEEGRHARGLHARQRSRSETADDQPIDATGARRGAPSKTRRCRTRAPAPKCWCSKNGNWALIYNDLERGRYSLAVSLVGGRGTDLALDATSRARRCIRPTSSSSASTTTRRSSRRRTAPCTPRTAFSRRRRRVKPDAEGRLPRKAIKHAHFNEAWIRGEALIPEVACVL